MWLRVHVEGELLPQLLACPHVEACRCGVHLATHLLACPHVIWRPAALSS